MINVPMGMQNDEQPEDTGMDQSGLTAPSSMFDEIEKDKELFLGNPQVAGARSFRRAVEGIENGDYQGLEQLDFGAIDGTPAVSFVDEDGQRQVFKLTIPQWAAALESRSRARKQLDAEYKQDAIKRALMPQYRQILKSVPGAGDAVGSQAWMELYDMDPETAYRLAGASLKKDTPTAVLYGTEQPKPIVDAYNAMLGEQYKQRQAMLETQRQSTNDTNTLAFIGSVQSLIRPPQASIFPKTITVSEYAAQSGMGTLPIVNAITMASMPLGIPGMPKPIVPPTPNQNGEYTDQQLQRFAQEFNSGVVGPILGWAPYDMNNEMHRDELTEVLNHYNAVRSGAVAVRPPESTRQPRPGYMRQAEETIRGAVVESPKAPQGVQAKVSTDVERDIQIYGNELYAMAYGKDPPQDERVAAEQFVSLIMERHEQNERLIAEGRTPLRSPPPEVIAGIYNAIMQRE